MKLLPIAQVPPATVGPEATVLEAVNVMAHARVGAVVVMEIGRTSELRGIFTERDLMLRVVLPERNPRETLVRDVMTSPVRTATEETSAVEVLYLMREHHLRHLPILGSEGQVLGMLSIRNLLEGKVEDQDRQLNSLEQYITNDSLGG